MVRLSSLLSVCGAALVLGACASDPIVAVPVPAVVETAAMTGVGDRADDPAVWVNPLDASKSLILGTNKEEGLYVYDLSGAELQKLAVGRLNNVDVRGTVAVGSNDETNSLSWFMVDVARATVSHMGDTPTDKLEPYGICAGVMDGVYLAAPTYKDGMVQIWAADGDSEPGTVKAELVRTVQLGGQLEGCVFDDAEARLFIGEEEHGIWSLDLSDPESQPVSVDTIAAGNGLVMDVEGLSMWLGDDGAGYLVASAQAKDRFVVYDRLPPHAVVGVVTVAPSVDGSIDAVTHTDGLDIVSAALPGFPRGVMVVQDDGNPKSGVDQNFKVVDWREIEAALGIAQ